jgi:hypothetical protein
MYKSRDRWQTVAKAFDDICNNETPWVAIGNFLNYWWAYGVDHRLELIEMPLASAPVPTLKTQRWAAFCAAMVEWLCSQADLPCPAWTNQESYILSKPWFFYKDSESRSQLMARTPAPFQMRNIFGGDRMFLHKWDMAKEMKEGKFIPEQFKSSYPPQAS